MPLFNNEKNKTDSEAKHLSVFMKSKSERRKLETGLQPGIEATGIKSQEIDTGESDTSINEVDDKLIGDDLEIAIIKEGEIKKELPLERSGNNY